MAEQIVLTTPRPQPVQVTGYVVSQLHLAWSPTPQIVIVLQGDDGKTVDMVYEGATATTMLRQLNKANLSTRSLIQRILDAIIADGKVAGTVAGSVP